MKQLSFLLIFNLIPYLVFSQSRYSAVEIFMGTENVSPSSKDIEFYLSASTVWGSESVYSSTYYLTNEYHNSTYLVPINNNIPQNWRGWDFVTSKTGGNPHPPIYGWGRYKISTDESSTYFYIDFRDDRLGDYKSFGTPYGQPIDIWIKYDDSANKFYIKSHLTHAWSGPLSYGGSEEIWNIKRMGSPTIGKFSLYLTLSNQNNHPKLDWVQYHDSNIIGYYLYRKIIPKIGSLQAQQK